MADDNIIQFPKLVEIKEVWSDGLFGVTVDKVKKVTVYETSIHIWFSEPEDEEPWDLTIEHVSHEDATNSYHELLNLMRRLRMKRV